MALCQPRPQGLLTFQNGGVSGEDPGTQQITCLQRGWRCIQNGGYGEKYASSVSFSRLHDNAVSYVLLSQLCTSPSVVHYSVSCVLLLQLCITRSVVYYPVSCHPVSWMIIPSVVYYSVSCVLFHHLCITPSGEFNSLFPISIFETLSNFTHLQVTQLIVLLSRKFF